MKKYLLPLIASGFFAAIFLTAPHAEAAIGFDRSQGTQNVNLTNVDLSVTVTSTQSNLLLVFKVFASKTTAGAGGGVTGVIYDGLSLTKLISTTSAAVQSSTWSMWYLVAPPSGTFNSTTTLSAANAFSVCAESYYNVNQTTPFDASSSAYVSATSTGGVVSTTMTTLNANDVITSMAADNGPAGSGSVDPSPGQGDIGTCNFSVGGLHSNQAYRYIPLAGPTSTVWNNGTSTWYGMVAGSIVPAISSVMVTADVTITNSCTINSGITIR